MLRKLSVQNFALIDHTEFNPHDALNIITGETGAGKSILLDALSLLTGQRANFSIIRDKTKKCIVEAEFDAKGIIQESFFSKLDVDFAEICIVRREIQANGNGRAFINDTPAGLQALKDLAVFWIDIHSQFETAKIHESSFWFDVLDCFSELSLTVTQYREIFDLYSKNIQLLKTLEQQKADKEKDRDYKTYLLNELLELNYSEGEEKKLDEELTVLSNSESIRETLEKSDYLLSESEQSIIAGLNEVKSSISSSAKYSNNLLDVFKRIDSALLELKDISLEISSLKDEFISDPLKLEYVNDRLSVINKLKRKHSINDAEELLEILSNLNNEIENANEDEEKIKSLLKTTEQQKSELKKLASILHSKRIKNKEAIEKTTTDLLKKLGIVNASFEIEITEQEQLNEFGNNKLNVLFSANKGTPLMKVSDVASGGELSRLMLAVKYITAMKKQLPTIVFDEIDVGVSGEIAWQMAEMMKEMSNTTQLVCITHSPQIAGKGNHHFYVFKETEGEVTNSRIRQLNKEQRITEIAKMLSHGNPTEAAINNAKELLQN